MQRKFIFIFAVFLVALNFFVWREVFALNQVQKLRVDFLSVGQGDSAFVVTPAGNKILIDGGPDASVLGKLAANMPFWDKEIDLVVLTHPESDHMQGLLEALQKYKADYILWSGVKKTAPEYNKWLEVLEKQKKMGAKILIAKSGLEIKSGNVLLDTMYPLESLEGKDMKSTSNDSCVVEKIIFGKDSFLFTGDISSVAEKEIANSGENILADVLKVAHHGSKYSTSDLFLQTVRPKFAVIEVGKNTYGHPTADVLNRLQNFGIKMFRTDKDGDVKFLSDGNNIQLQ